MNDSVVMAAWIAGGLSIVGPIVTYVATKAYEQRFLDRIPEGRQRALSGTWEGFAIQDGESGQPPVKANLRFCFHIQNRVVLGEGDFRGSADNNEYDLRLKLEGNLLYDRYLRLNYRNSDHSAIQFGMVIAELDPEGRSLVGRFTGYGATTKDIVHGTINIKKVV